MNEAVEKKRNFLINLAFVAVVLGLVYVFFKYLFWLVAPFLLSFLFAVALQKPLRALDKKTKNRFHTFFSIALVILCLCILVVPLAFILAGIVDKVREFISYIMDQLNDLPAFLESVKKWLLDFLSFLPKSIYDSVSDTIVDTFAQLNYASNTGAEALNQAQSAEAGTGTGISLDSISSGITSGISGVYSIVKSVPSVLISVVIGIIAWIFFTKDYRYIVNFIQRQLPKEKKNILVELKQVFNKTIVTMFKAYGIIMCITFLELFLGFFIMTKLGIMDNEYYILIAVGTAIFDILPVAGSGGVLVPWTIFSFITGNYKQGIGLLILYVCMTVFRQYIEPKIVGTSLGVHPIVTLMGLYFGLKLFGFMGMILVPVTIMTLKAFNDTGRISIWKTANHNRN